MIFHHDLSPILFSLGPVSVRWYGLMYAIGLMAAYLIAMRNFKRSKYSLDHLDSLVIYLFFGMLIGARLGHVFFYEASYYLAHPIEIFMVWKGGLASHGGALGVFLAYLLWKKVHKVKFSEYVDAVVIGIPLLAGLIRMGNFFNSEIVGYPTNSNYGVVFERLGEDFARHPVQLYSALMNWIVFVILFVSYEKYYKKAPKPFFMFLYVLLYFSGRFIVEFWKDLHGPIDWLPISMGQLLSIPGILIGVIGLLYLKRKSAT